MTLLAVVLSVNFTSCSDDDDDEEEKTTTASLVGKWKIEKVVDDEGTSEWDGYPYFVLNETHCYFTDEAGETKSDYSTYTYDADKKIINASYVNRDYSYIIRVLKLTDSELQWQWDEEDNDKWTTFHCKKAN